MMKKSKIAVQLPSFGLAITAWLLATFPCVPKLYSWSHPFATISDRHFLGDYVLLSIMGPLLLWALSWKQGIPTRTILALGCLTGVLTGVALWTRSFELAASRLDPDRFLYAGLLAGVAGYEIRRRTIFHATAAALKKETLKRDFVIAALALWAVLLKFSECFGMASTEAGPGWAVIAIHIFMFLSVLLWTPWICNLLWRYARTAPSSFFWPVLSGVVMPPIAAVILYLPVMVLFFAGISVAYAMLWGGAIFLHGGPWWQRGLYLAPGLLWGISIGWLRWRYLTLERQSASI